MESTKSSRLIEIDIARGLGILLVVLGHNWLFINHYRAFNEAIYTFHVPLFFFLSGLIFKPQEGYRELMLKRLASLLKPYFIVLITYEAYRLLFGASNFLKPILGILYATGQSIYITPLWFLPHLFCVILLANFLIRFINNRLNQYYSNIVVIGILVVGVFLLHFFNNTAFYNSIRFKETTNIPLGLPFSIDVLMVSTAFFLLGYVNAEIVKLIRPSFFFIILSFSIFMVVNLFFDSSLDLNSRIYGSLIPTSAAAFSGIWMIIAVSKLISVHLKFIAKVLSYVGSASLFILIFHGIVQGVLAHKLNLFFPKRVYLSIFLSSGLSIIISCILFNISTRFPKLRSIIQ